MKQQQKYLLAGGLAVLALAGTALASVYVADNRETVAAPTQNTRVVYKDRAQVAAAQPVQAKPPCDDNNIVGTIGGGIAGGVIGNQFGSGSGQTAATVGGALGGAALGNKFIPARGVTCD